MDLNRSVMSDITGQRVLQVGFTSWAPIQYRNYLRDNGIQNSEKHQTTIRVSSGRISTDIKVSYKDFYEQLEKCKFVLTDCNYNLEII